MGQNESSLGGNSIQGMQMASNFTQAEIKRLIKRFEKLDKDGSGTISIAEFMSITDLHANPLVGRVLSIFDEDTSGEVDLQEFIMALSVFSVKGDKLEKLKFAFKVYDIDNDELISNGELFQVLKMMVGNNLKDYQLQQIVDKTIAYADHTNKGSVSFDEFCELVGHTDVDTKMSVEV